VKVVLNVPYLSQRDNLYNPSGACNVTSVAMAMKWFGIVGDGSLPQLEDQLYVKASKEGWSRHHPWGIQKLFEWKGLVDRFDEQATVQKIRTHFLNRGGPVVIHGFFTRFGHIPVIIGFDDLAYNGRGAFVLHDPWGEYPYYLNQGSGINVRYSYNLLTTSPVSPDGFIFAHFVSRK